MQEREFVLKDELGMVQQRESVLKDELEMVRRQAQQVCAPAFPTAVEGEMNAKQGLQRDAVVNWTLNKGYQNVCEHTSMMSWFA